VRKKNYQCLMVQTKDNRKFFTPEKNYVQLIEFANTFDAEISVVKLVEPYGGRVLDLGSLAQAVSDNNYQSPGCAFEIVERRIGKGRSHFKNLPAAREIKDHLKQMFVNGEVVDFHQVKNKFGNYNLTYNAFAAHMFKMRKQLRSEGFDIEKVGVGKYRIASRESQGKILPAIPSQPSM
jgi:hypothetical protein